MEDMVKKNNFWRNRNVFVTGCTGLLGSWLTKSLIEKKANVVGLIRDWVPQSNLFTMDLFNRITTVRGEVEDEVLLERIINEYEIETVFHLAAQTIVGIANNNPVSTFRTNIMGTWNILEASRRNKRVKQIIVASSDKAYGESPDLPYDEKTPLRGMHPYDVSKSCADLLSASYFKTYRLPVCVTRCGNFFGGGDLNFNRLIPGTIRSALLDERPIIRSDGSCIRDYFYIKDAANAYMYLAEKMSKIDIAGQAFNFGNEIRVSVLDMARKILKLMKKENLKPIVLNEADCEIQNQYLSSKKAREILKWKPLYSLDEGLKETIEWYKKLMEKNL